MQGDQIRRRVAPSHRDEPREAVPEPTRGLRPVASLRDAVDERAESHRERAGAAKVERRAVSPVPLHQPLRHHAGALPGLDEVHRRELPRGAR